MSLKAALPHNPQRASAFTIISLGPVFRRRPGHLLFQETFLPITIDEIFAQDRENRPNERRLRWEESRDGITVVIEPKPHWAEDMRAFRLDVREYCRYADWTASGGRARFYGHIDTSGDTVMMKARAMIAREIADGLWS